jgi:Flp pilus assembly protein TadG
MRLADAQHEKRTPRRAAAAAELAFILPVLVMIVLGCVDFGRFLYTYIAVTNAARAGAGYGSVNAYTTSTYGTWQTDIRSAVIDELSGVYGFDSGDLTVTSTGVTESSGYWRAQVQVQYPFETLVSWPSIPSSITMQRTAVMRGIR